MTGTHIAPESVEAERETPKQQVLVAALVALVVFLAAALVLTATGHGPLAGKARAASSDVTIGVPTAMTEQELRAFSANSAIPVYWAGPRDGVTYEVTKTSDGSVFVRYLTNGVKVGDQTASYLTVGTYYQPGGYTALSTTSQEAKVSSSTMRSGALVVQREDSPGSTWFSFPDADFQVEVYHPEAGHSFTLVSNGDVAPLN